MASNTIFKNYDIRGEYGKELNPLIAYKIAKAYVIFSKAKRVVVGADTRLSSPDLKAAVISGLVESGVEVVDIGLVATDVVYFATWHGKYDGGIMITASHMPKQFNGMKFLRLNDEGMLEPIGRGLGMDEIEKIVNEMKDSGVEAGGSIDHYDIWGDYVKFVRDFVDISKIGPLKVVMDAGNGMGGLVAEKLFKGMDLEIIPMYFEPDGAYPNHEPNPFVEENRKEIVAKVKKVGADLGIAWDADCDRVYFIDEKGEYIHGDLITALLSIYFLKKKEGSGIVYDLRSSWAVHDWIKKMNGVPHTERVGHAYIKSAMRKTDSIFGGEVSGHYYFADNAYMDNGFIPEMILMEMISKEKKPLSEIIKSLGEYYIYGEVNFTVENIDKVLQRLEEKYKNGKINKIDGLAVEFEDWHFNVRPSANDPVLRLNLEAKSDFLMRQKFDEISEFIYSFKN